MVAYSTARTRCFLLCGGRTVQVDEGDLCKGNGQGICSSNDYCTGRWVYSTVICSLHRERPCLAQRYSRKHYICSGPAAATAHAAHVNVRKAEPQSKAALGGGGGSSDYCMLVGQHHVMDHTHVSCHAIMQQRIPTSLPYMHCQAAQLSL